MAETPTFAPLRGKRPGWVHRGGAWGKGPVTEEKITAGALARFARASERSVDDGLLREKQAGSAVHRRRLVCGSLQKSHGRGQTEGPPTTVRPIKEHQMPVEGAGRPCLGAVRTPLSCR